MRLPRNPKLKQRARELRKAGVLSEVIFWQAVNRKQFLGLDFDRQKIIGNYIVDFYIKRLGIIVEIDGSSHDNKIEYDEERELFLKGLGLDVIHFTDKQIKTNLDGVVEYLKNYIIENYSIGE